MTEAGRNFRLRLLSALVMIPLALAAVIYGDPGNPAYFLLIAGGMAAALVEWLRLVAPALPKSLIVMACASLVFVLLTGYRVSMVTGVLALGVLTVVLLLVIGFVASRRAAVPVAFGLPYLGGAGLSLLSLRDAPDYGMMLTFYLLAVVWGTDIGGYMIGRKLKGPKLAPRISPNKTWSGFIGGTLMAVLAGLAVIWWSDGRDMRAAALVALLLSLLAQAGDLFESAFKRRAGVKGSGQLIPGHGGVLDRIDGLVFASIAFALLRRGCEACTGWW